MKRALNKSNKFNRKWNNLALACLWVLSICASSYQAKAQYVVADSGAVVSLDKLKLWVRQNHPVSRQANGRILQADAEILSAKGGFDPTISTYFEQKQFDGKNYFSLGEYGVKLPTWYGIELKASYNTARGQFLNPEEKLPSIGQAQIGVSVPVLQNLFFDERRAALARARQSRLFSEAQRRLALNDLFFETTVQYWKWAWAQAQKKTIKQALDVAQTRFDALKMQFSLGDRPAFDTLEAFIQVQDRTLQYLEATQFYIESGLKLGQFLWQTDSLPQQWNLEIVPQNLPDFSPQTPASIWSDSFETQAIRAHPALELYTLKNTQLAIEQRLKREKLKPKLNLNYNFLSQGVNWSSAFTDNYKWGVSLSTPILFRTERGDLAQTGIKISLNSLEQTQKTMDLRRKLQTAIAQVRTLEQQMQLYAETLNNYKKLLELENMRFDLGESSLFLVNSRETKLIEVQVKWAKMNSEYQIAKTAISWCAGVLFE
jgi:outer membrane protein TolC